MAVIRGRACSEAEQHLQLYLEWQAKLDGRGVPPLTDDLKQQVFLGMQGGGGGGGGGQRHLVSPLPAAVLLWQRRGVVLEVAGRGRVRVICPGGLPFWAAGAPA